MVAVGTANFNEPATTVQVIEGIEQFMQQNGVKDINELIGCVKQYKEADFGVQMVQNLKTVIQQYGETPMKRRIIVKMEAYKKEFIDFLIMLFHKLM